VSTAANTPSAAPPPDATDSPADAAPPRAAYKSPRRRSRELALQGLYDFLISGEQADAISLNMREQDDFDGCDEGHFEALLRGCIAEASTIDEVLGRHVDRKTSLLSPVEHGVLMIGVYELIHCLDIPYRVVINEAVELAKVFGGTDGHKYVNGVIDKAAGDLRAAEVATPRTRRR
jgi:N utilization substance protein B